MPIQAGAEPVDESHCADVQGRRLHHAPGVARGAHPTLGEAVQEAVLRALGHALHI